MYIYSGKAPDQHSATLGHIYPLLSAQPVNQLQGTPAIPCVYGRWCGPGCSGPGAPVDDVDQCCQEHDQCYSRRGYFDCRCNRELMACIAPKISLRTPKGRAALAVWTTFSRMPCIPRR